MTTKKNKAARANVKVTAISLPPDLLVRAHEKRREKRLTFSGYVCELIREDTCDVEELKRRLRLARADAARLEYLCEKAASKS